MKYTVEFEASAKHDLLTAFQWYETRQPGLGGEFLHCVAAVEEALARDPERYAIANAPYRSAKLRRFPYGLHYRIIGNRVSVIACLHFRQSPSRWPGA